MTARTTLAFCLALLVAVLAAGPAGSQAGEGDGSQVQRPGRSGLPLPRFVSLRAGKVNLRTGPGIRYPIDWVYLRPGLPLEVIDEFETWRRVRDWQGSVGWVHQSMLTGRRNVMIAEKQRLLRREPSDEAPGVALVEPRVVAGLVRCTKRWCRVGAKGFEGWLKKSEIFGVYPDETIE